MSYSAVDKSNNGNNNSGSTNNTSSKLPGFDFVSVRFFTTSSVVATLAVKRRKNRFN